jgi:hypothetical protein
MCFAVLQGYGSGDLVLKTINRDSATERQRGEVKSTSLRGCRDQQNDDKNNPAWCFPNTCVHLVPSYHPMFGQYGKVP